MTKKFDLATPLTLLSVFWFPLKNLLINKNANENRFEQMMNKSAYNISKFLLCGAIINPIWLELSLSGTNFYGLKGVRDIEVRL